jgi:hypothetical protein
VRRQRTRATACADRFAPGYFGDGSRGDYEARAQRERLEEEEEAKRLYEETVGDVSREVSSEAVPTEMPDGEANR